LRAAGPAAVLSAGVTEAAGGLSAGSTAPSFTFATVASCTYEHWPPNDFTRVLAIVTLLVSASSCACSSSDRLGADLPRRPGPRAPGTGSVVGCCSGRPGLGTRRGPDLAGDHRLRRASTAGRLAAALAYSIGSAIVLTCDARRPTDHDHLGALRYRVQVEAPS
jgi:hypothetical protein